MMGKIEAGDLPILGQMLKDAGFILFDRTDREAAIAACDDAAERIKQGQSLCIAPEGTRSFSKRLAPFKKGAFATAKDLDLAILPVTITGTNHILPPATVDLKPGHAFLIVHPPITRDTVRALGSRELSNMCRDAIQAGLDEPHRATQS